MQRFERYFLWLAEVQVYRYCYLPLRILFAPLRNINASARKVLSVRSSCFPRAVEQIQWEAGIYGVVGCICMPVLTGLLT